MIPALRLHDISVMRGETRAVRSVSLSVARAGWFGLIGANGSGKTSLLRAIGGRLPVASGRLDLLGVDATDDDRRRADMIGFAPDPAMLPATLSPRDVLRIVAGDSDAAFASLGPLREVLEIDALADRQIGTLSSGMRQRVAIACAFARRPEIAILDEPFNWLDPVAAYDLRAALSSRVRAGLTLLTALHDAGTLSSACDQAAVLTDGALALELDKEMLSAAALDPSGFERRTITLLRSTAPRPV